MSDERYLDLAEGMNKVWVTGIKFDRGTNDKPRPYFSLSLCKEPTSVSHTSPFTRAKVFVPMAGDTTPAIVLMEAKIKAILYPLAGFESNVKTSIKGIYDTIKAGLDQYDYQCDIVVEKKPGRGVNSEGNPVTFDEIIQLTVESYAEKKAYEAMVDVDDLPME